MLAPNNNSLIDTKAQAPGQVPDGIIICELDERMIPGTIIYANKAALILLGYTSEHLLSITFHDICSVISICENYTSELVLLFQATIKRIDNTEILCQFSASIHSDIDTAKFHAIFKPVEKAAENHTLVEQTINSNKQILFDDCSSGVAHDLNNAVNLITLSSDLLSEIVNEMRHTLEKSESPQLIRGMDQQELTKTTDYLISNLTTSSLKISTLTQAFFQFFRKPVRPLSDTYDVRKILQSIISITECEIKKVSTELQFDPPQGIIKRTGNSMQIQQALMNCIFFICKSITSTAHPFNILTLLKPQQNEFCISIGHAGCTILPSEFLEVFYDNSSAEYKTYINHPLITAQSLIVQNGGNMDIHSGNPAGIEISITFSALNDNLQ